ncbi:HAMP domain-containing sensor histidine kinase [Arthrobacter sp. zg-Y820]|uniref:sensor histidine kinase n=1 Tax=unclassified Arthrobacter TaxID=235627 RepID=UPI001E315612|nr:MULTISPECIES: HAMP domain-containing sensor histidine kinase [unclassified Arthrobacter]MCC9198025.1 HAMP domain-containing histidine kinase [Arthrobacter sp. zg-Y820]MDK1280892.1 HAMP domain-containing sensor histidine kinase [Arthrobacter sp. zg.Y820]WIB10370.1 HAMP domain-containing sensor histidine kinase [Arthrobacter sp. zg-Y820]
MSRLATRVLSSLGLQTEFYELSLNQRIKIAHGPLVITVILLCAIYALLLPEVLHRPAFQTGLVLLLLITVAAAVVPWNRFWYPTYWILPLMDFVAIGFLYNGSQGLALGVYLLSVFPVFWMAWSRVSTVGARVLSFVGPLIIVWYPAFVSEIPITGQRLAAPILGPLVTLAVAVTVTLVRQDMAAQQAALAHKDELLEKALAESTERSELLDVVLNAIDVGVLVVGANGSAVHKNARMQVLDDRVRPAGMKHTQEQDLLFFGADRTTALAPDERPVGRAMKGESFQDVLIWSGPAGHQMALSCSARILRNENGFNGAVITFNDITALADALRAKDDFVSNVSHELRTPLTSIIGYLDLAQAEAEDTGLTGTIPQALDVSLRNSERLLSLVSDLLTAASGSVALDPRPFSVDAGISAGLRSASPRAAAGGVVLAAEHAPGLTVHGDPGRLAQVMDNLLSNAIKYSPDGGTVTVRVWTEPGRAFLQVQDTGMGMDDADQRELFTKFFRTGAVRRAGIPGAGLGLAITKNIVEAHGGTISLCSEPGRGSTFTVAIPQPQPPAGTFAPDVEIAKTASSLE